MEKDFLALACMKLQKSGECILRLKVRAGAQKTSVRGVLVDGTIKFDIAAVREDGKANTALIEFLSGIFAVARQNISIITGQTSSKKVIKIIRTLR